MFLLKLTLTRIHARGALLVLTSASPVFAFFNVPPKLPRFGFGFRFGFRFGFEFGDVLDVN
jgi:hypothetical protein